MNKFLDGAFWKDIKRSGLKVSFIADRAGLSLKRLSEIINGHIQATPDERQRIQAVLAITIGKGDADDHQDDLSSDDGVSDIDPAGVSHLGRKDSGELKSRFESGLETHNKLNNQARSESK